MPEGHFERITFFVIAFILVLGNLVLLMPNRTTFALFVRLPMAPTNLTLTTAEGDHTSLVLLDNVEGRVVPDGFYPGDLRVPVAQSYLDHRRTRHLLRIGKIALYVRSGDSNESVVSIWRAFDVWQPDDESPLRFELPLVSFLEPGRHQIHALLYADPPWGIGESPDAEQSLSEDYAIRAVVPGRFLLRSVRTESITIVVTEPEE